MIARSRKKHWCHIQGGVWQFSVCCYRPTWARIMDKRSQHFQTQPLTTALEISMWRHLWCIIAGCNKYSSLCKTSSSGLSAPGKTRLDRERAKMCIAEMVRRLGLHVVCFNWDRLIGTMSKFWGHVVCLFVCMAVCVYVGKLGHRYEKFYGVPIKPYWVNSTIDHDRCGLYLLDRWGKDLTYLYCSEMGAIAHRPAGLTCVIFHCLVLCLQ